MRSTVQQWLGCVILFLSAVLLMGLHRRLWHVPVPKSFNWADFFGLGVAYLAGAAWVESLKIAYRLIARW